MIGAARKREKETAAHTQTTEREGGKEMIFSFAILVSMDGGDHGSSVRVKELEFLRNCQAASRQRFE